MFDVGERVVCVIPHTAFGMREGRTYVVSAILSPVGIYDPCFDGPASCTIALAEIWHNGERQNPPYGFDPRRFRPLRKLDTSQSLKALKDLTVNCPPLETAGR